MYRKKIYRVLLFQFFLFSLSCYAINPSYFKKRQNPSQIKNSFNPSDLLSKKEIKELNLDIDLKEKMRHTYSQLRKEIDHLTLYYEDIENIYKIILLLKNKLDLMGEDSYSIFIKPEKNFLKLPLQLYKNNRQFIHLKGVDKKKNKGSYKRFYRSYDINKGELVATLESNYDSIKSYHTILKELTIMEKLKDSKNNLTYIDFDIYRQNRRSFFVMHTELYDEDLSERLKRYMSHSDKVKIAYQAANSVDELHKKNIIHRDIKERNFLVTNKNGKLKLVLIDYGLSKDFVENEETFGIAGTRGYIDPYICKKRHGLHSHENLQKSYYLKKNSDIFSLGVVLHQIFYPEEKEIYETVYRMNLHVLPKIGSPRMYKLKDFLSYHNSLEKMTEKKRFKKLSGNFERKNRRLESTLRTMLSPLPIYRPELNKVISYLEKENRKVA